MGKQALRQEENLYLLCGAAGTVLLPCSSGQSCFQRPYGFSAASFRKRWPLRNKTGCSIAEATGARIYVIRLKLPRRACWSG